MMLTLYSDATPLRYAITSESGKALWYGAFISEIPETAAAAEMDAARKAVWLASKLGAMENYNFPLFYWRSRFTRQPRGTSSTAKASLKPPLSRLAETTGLGLMSRRIATCTRRSYMTSRST